MSAQQVRAMCDTMHHRGPDQNGIWHSAGVALGHNRLSILDLSDAARNPMPNEDGSVWYACNGEIYNQKDLRETLEKQGHVFRSRTDTEVILHSYEEKGPACVEDFNGMFAFAVVDEKNRRLFLARDRFGVKPLYYTVVGQTLAFASEIKAFLALSGFHVRANAEALFEHFTFQNTLGDLTFFRGVHLLSAGHYLIAQDGKISVQEYWDLNLQGEDGPQDVQAWATGLREHFERAVQRQLASDVPLGSYLSGGMDTGSICAVAARQIPSMHTFTCGFQVDESMHALEQYFDESPTSHDLARHLGTVHHAITLGPMAMPAVLPEVVWHLDEPRVGISYQIYHTTQLIGRHVKVVLSGVGGDELFAGYPWRYDPILDCPPDTFEQSYYGLWVRLLSDEEKSRLFTPEIKRQLNGYSTFDAFRKILRRATGTDPLNQALYFDFKTLLHGLLLVEDKLSMAHSIEARVPFLDNELVDYVARMPAQIKFQPGKSKVILRQAMEGLLPQAILSGRKQGFTPPDRSWYQGPNRDYVRDLILGDRAMNRGYFEPSVLKEIFNEHLENKRDHRFLLWSLMCFEWWNRLFVDGERPEMGKMGSDLSISKRWGLTSSFPTGSAR